MSSTGVSWKTSRLYNWNKVDNSKLSKAKQRKSKAKLGKSNSNSNSKSKAKQSKAKPKINNKTKQNKRGRFVFGLTTLCLFKWNYFFFSVCRYWFKTIGIKSTLFIIWPWTEKKNSIKPQKLKWYEKATAGQQMQVSIAFKLFQAFSKYNDRRTCFKDQMKPSALQEKINRSWTWDTIAFSLKRS